MAPQFAEEIKDTVARELAKIQATEEEQPIQLQPAEPSVEEKSSNGPFIAFLLAIVMFIVSSGAIYMMYQKNQQGYAGKDSMTSTELQYALKPFVDSTNKRLDSLEKRVDATDKRLEVMAHRHWALSIAFNNNTSIQEYNLRMTNPDHANKIIWLDADWRLNKAPAFIQLSDEDRRKLIEGIK